MEEDSKQQMNMTQKEAYKNGDRNGQNSEIYKLTQEENRNKKGTKINV